MDLRYLCILSIRCLGGTGTYYSHGTAVDLHLLNNIQAGIGYHLNNVSVLTSPDLGGGSILGGRLAKSNMRNNLRRERYSTD
jgi:hypothetical protein